MNVNRKILTAILAILISIEIGSFANDTEIVVKRLDEHVVTVSIMHYTSLVVIGTKEVLITDPANAKRARLLKKEIEKITVKPVGKVVLSHEHFDHTGGTEVFSGAEIIAHENIREFEGLDPLEMVPDTITTTFSKHMMVDMGTTKVTLHHFGVGDGVAAAIVFLPEERIVFSSDMYLDHGLNPGVYLTDTNLLGNRKYLNILAGWELKHAVNAHSVNTDPAALKATAVFLNDLYDAVLPRVQAIMTEAPGKMVPKILALSQTLEMPRYKDWPNYQDLPAYVRLMAFSIVHGG